MDFEVLVTKFYSKNYDHHQYGDCETRTSDIWIHPNTFGHGKILDLNCRTDTAVKLEHPTTLGNGKFNLNCKTKTPDKKKYTKTFGNGTFNLYCKTKIILKLLSLDSNMTLKRKPEDDQEEDPDQPEVSPEGNAIKNSHNNSLLHIGSNRQQFLTIYHELYLGSNRCLFSEETALLQEEEESVKNEEGGGKVVRKRRKTITEESETNDDIGRTDPGESELCRRRARNIKNLWNELCSTINLFICWRAAKSAPNDNKGNNFTYNRADTVTMTTTPTTEVDGVIVEMETEEQPVTEEPQDTPEPVRRERTSKRTAEAKARRKLKEKKRRAEKRRAEAGERANREGRRSEPPNGEQRLSPQPNPTDHSEPVTGSQQRSSTHPTTTPSQNTHRAGPTFNVEVTPTAGPPTEEVRREIMGFLAMRIAEMPLTETTVPVSLRDSRIVGGRILLVCDDEGSQGVVTELLGIRDDFTVGTGPVLRRYAFGGPGYLTSLTGRQIVQFLQRQNPDLPPDSLTFVSMNTGGRSPTVYVDVNEAGHTYLGRNGYKLKTMTTTVTLRPAKSRSQRTD